jgi:hypothetical protein
MSERMAAEIRIGGPIPDNLVPELCQTIQRACVGLECGCGDFSPKTADDLLNARVDDYGYGPLLLILYDDDAKWGEFEELEIFLGDSDIAYDRFSEGTHDCSPEISQFRPGQGLITQKTDPAYAPVVSTKNLDEMYHVLSQAIGQLGQGENATALRALRRARRILRDNLPPEVAPLELFEIVHHHPEEVQGGQ